jgi:ribosomal protein S18 acetylase RimI-like enzyme
MKGLQIKKCRGRKRILMLLEEIFPDADPEFSKADIYFVAKVGGRDVGFAHLAPKGGKLLLQGIGVKEGFRGGGIGGRLLDAAVNLAERAGKEMLLKVKPENTVALNLYAKRGFVIKRVRGVYILQRKLCN